MLTKKQLEEIKYYLEQSQNPLFFFDNDVDGLASFLILQRYIGRGKGIAIKSFPGLNKSYFRKVEELNPDSIFILDKPKVDQDFIDLVLGKNLPLIYIDHHDVPKPNVEHYYNSFHVSKKNEPTSYLCYKATEKKEDLWLAIIGCIGDGFIPEFIEEFRNQYPDLIDFNYTEAYDIMFRTQIGKVARILDYALKDSTTNVIHMIKYLMKARGPYDVLEENSRTESFLKRYEFINSKIKNIVAKAEKEIDIEKNLLFFTYGGDMSLSQHVSNELFYNHPSLTIVVGYNNGNIANFSLRGVLDVRELTLESIKDIQGATGGGHRNSTGAKMTSDNIEKFKENILKNLKKMKV